MKKNLLILSVLALGFSAQAQNLETIIAKNIEARGGLEKLKKLNSLIMESSMNANGAELPMKVTLLNKKGFRMDLQIMGMDNYMICNTKEGYSFFPIQGQKAPEKMPDDAVRDIANQFDLQGEFIDYKEKGITLTYQGEEDVDGTMCHKILCIYSNKSEKRIFIDKESNQVIKETQKVTVNGKETEQVTEYSNFQNIDGYTFAYETNSQMGSFKVKKVLINPEVKETLFEIKK